MKWRRTQSKAEQEREAVADAARGLSVATIGQRRGLKPERVRELIARSREPLTDAVTTDLGVELQRHLSFHDAVIEDYQRIFEETDEDTLRLRALEGRSRAIAERSAMLKEFGALPLDPSHWYRVTRYEPLVEQLFDELRERGVAEHLLQESALAVAKPSTIDAALAANDNHERGPAKA
jgi:hypothetical protein